MKYNINKTQVEVTEGGTITTFEDGSQLIADTVPENHDEQIHFARSLGYGEDVARMNRDHDLCHTILAHALGEDYCPVIHGVASDNPADPYVARDRESIVFLMQKLSNVGVTQVAQDINRGE